jgi:RNA polymerase sigma factor (sigma-70 family)
MPASPSESQLIEKCCDGSRTAYREFYELYAGQLLVVAMRYMKTKEEAEDVLQETYIKAFKNLASFDQRSSLKTWLTRITINTALNQLRKKHEIINWTSAEAIDKPVETLPIDHLRLNELIDLIQRLPTGCQLVFNLYAIEGYAHKEIAEKLEISEGTSKSQLYRAKDLLRTMILEEEQRTKRKAV